MRKTYQLCYTVSSEMTRRYEQRVRAERTEETRRRIVEATAALHEEVGPAQTTIAAIAERAGVSRPTVYNQFPEERQLFAACRGLFFELHPLPELDGLALEETLLALYAYYEANERMLTNVLRDAELLPALHDVLSEWDVHLAALRDRLADGADTRTRGAIGHALSFWTWRSLVREQGLEQREAVSLMLDAAAPALAA
jgi:AcrR family transcriptional regulator